jgi:hypothetical protein
MKYGIFVLDIREIDHGVFLVLAISTGDIV